MNAGGWALVTIGGLVVWATFIKQPAKASSPLYTSAAGDTASDIAARFGVSINDLFSADPNTKKLPARLLAPIFLPRIVTGDRGARKGASGSYQPAIFPPQSLTDKAASQLNLTRGMQ